MPATVSFLDSLDETLQTKYAFLRVDANPVMRGIASGSIGATRLAWILGQYCFLPIRIVEILGAMASASYRWKDLHEELLENIYQECGSLTKHSAHISILRDCLKKALGLDLTTATPCDVTDECLDRVLNTIRMQRDSREFIAGMAYGLEASALPELMVVADLINHLCTMRGRHDAQVTNHKRTSLRRAERLSGDKDPDDYSLDDFLVIHLCYIEVYHKNDLKKIIENHVLDSDGIQLVQDGFKFVLDSMESWWNELTAHPATEAAA